ncbi:MAG: hypothetical protein OSJ61_25580 [Lachnospiraceae bacterium]|nr:hypothetical protein [Lachnospiraceae bacterium]
MSINVTYSVNGNPISFEDLSSILITRKDYIDYVEDIKRKVNTGIEQSKERLKGGNYDKHNRL